MLVISDRHVKELLTIEQCMAALSDCLKAVSSGGAIQPMREMFRLPNGQGILGWMPGAVSQVQGKSALGFKLMSVVPVAPQRMAHNGVVVLFDETCGQVMAVVEAGSITAIRTPAASAVATNLLARPDSNRLAILGAGHQAQGHLAAMMAIREIKELQVWSLNLKSARAFASMVVREYGINARACETVAQAVQDMDIVCTCTSASDPVLNYEWLTPGTHVNVIGSSIPTTAEVDNACVAQTTFFVDHAETVKVQGGEFRRALDAGMITQDHIQAEIGDILLGRHPGRTDSREITLYKSVGIVAYDLAAACATYQAAMESGLRVDVELLRET